jgi:hypothetical protein
MKLMGSTGIGSSSGENHHGGENDGFRFAQPIPPRDLLGVLFGVLFRSFVVMRGGMQMMSVGDLGMVRGLFVISGFVVLGGFAMMLGRMLVMVRGLLVMFMDVVFVEVMAVHRRLPGWLR